MSILGSYLIVGALLAFATRRRLERAAARRVEAWLSALLCVVLWPLWAPIAWAAGGSRPGGLGSSEVERARDVLAEAKAAVAGTPLAALLTEDVVARTLAEMDQLAERRDELLRLARSGHGPQQADEDAPLLELAQRDSHRLAQLLDLVRALRTRLVLARYGGASLDGVGDLLAELTTRVESLDEVFAPAYGESRSRSQSLPL